LVLMALPDELRPGADIETILGRDELHAANVAASANVLDRIDLLAGQRVGKGRLETHTQDGVEDRPEAVVGAQLARPDLPHRPLDALPQSPAYRRQRLGYRLPRPFFVLIDPLARVRRLHRGTARPQHRKGRGEPNKILHASHECLSPFSPLGPHARAVIPTDAVAGALVRTGRRRDSRLPTRANRSIAPCHSACVR